MNAERARCAQPDPMISEALIVSRIPLVPSGDNQNLWSMHSVMAMHVSVITADLFTVAYLSFHDNKPAAALARHSRSQMKGGEGEPRIVLFAANLSPPPD